MQRYVWTTDDLRQALLAAYYAGVVAAPAPISEQHNAYQRGFVAALTTLALNCGLGPIPCAPPENATPRTKDQARVPGGHR